MKNGYHLKLTDTNLEVYARIIKATAKKYDCSMRIEYDADGLVTEFIGDDELMPHIIEEVESMFEEC